MYDAFIQAGYIVLDPDNADKQGTLYLEFAHVEQRKMYQELKRQETKLANLVLDRNVDNDTEADLQERFDAVKHHYRVPGKKNKHTNRLRNTWYEHDLRHLAKRIGQFDDYVFFLQRYHGSTHSSSLALNINTLRDSRMVQRLAAFVVGRCAKIIVDREKIKISCDSELIVKACNQDFVNLSILEQPPPITPHPDS